MTQIVGMCILSFLCRDSLCFLISELIHLIKYKILEIYWYYYHYYLIHISKCRNDNISWWHVIFFYFIDSLKMSFTAGNLHFTILYFPPHEIKRHIVSTYSPTYIYFSIIINDTLKELKNIFMGLSIRIKIKN